MKRPIRAREKWALWLERYLKRLEAQGRAPKTVESRRSMLGKFFEYTRAAKVYGPEGLSVGLVRSYLLHRRELPNRRGKKDRPRTLNTHLLAVRRFLDFLMREGTVSGVLVEAVEYVKEPKSLPRDIPTDQEVKRMLNAVDTTRSTGFRDRTVLELLYSTGIRRQEMMDLTVADVDLEGGYVRVELGKGGKGRIVPLGRIAAEWVKRYLLAVRPEQVKGRQDPGWLFLAKSGGKLDGEAVMKAARAAGLEKKITPHALRRACATEMIRGNANPWHVKELLGLLKENEGIAAQALTHLGIELDEARDLILEALAALYRQNRLRDREGGGQPPIPGPKLG